MVVIPPGTFEMGSPRIEAGRFDTEGPRHTVTIPRPYALGLCEVTVGQFRRFVSETGHVTHAEREGGCHIWSQVAYAGKRDPARRWDAPGFYQGEDHPVVCVALEDAEAYIDWLSGRTGARYRLPTEAEWEYAARARTTASRYWGDDPDAACDFANGADRRAKARYPDWETANCDDGHLYTAPAGTYRPSRFASTTCSGTSGNEQPTVGTSAMKRRRLTARPGERRTGAIAVAGCFAAGRGATTRGTSGRRAATGSRPASPATTSVPPRQGLVTLWNLCFVPLRGCRGRSPGRSPLLDHGSRRGAARGRVVVSNPG